MLYLENAGGESATRENPELVSEYLVDFERLRQMATDPKQLTEQLREINADRFNVS